MKREFVATNGKTGPSFDAAKEVLHLIAHTIELLALGHLTNSVLFAWEAGYMPQFLKLFA